MIIDGFVPWDGQGKKEDPYQIKTKDDITELADNVLSGEDFYDTYFLLMNDIQLDDTEWIAIGNDYIPFDGYFNGAGHCISNVMIKNGKIDSGFFGCIGMDSEVTNIKIQCNASSTHYGNTIGAIAGSNYGKISCCQGRLNAEMKITNEQKDLYIGGIAGINQPGGLIENSTCETIYAFTKQISLTQNAPLLYVGGIIGDNHSDVGIVNCTATVNWDISKMPKEMFCIGGLAGRNTSASIIDQCTVQGSMKATNLIHGLVEENNGIVKESKNQTLLENFVHTADGMVYGTVDTKVGTSTNNSMEGKVNVYLNKPDAKVKVIEGNELMVYSVNTKIS